MVQVAQAKRPVANRDVSPVIAHHDLVSNITSLGMRYDVRIFAITARRVSQGI